MKVKNVIFVLCFNIVAVFIIFWLFFYPTETFSETLKSLGLSVIISLALSCLAPFILIYLPEEHFLEEIPLENGLVARFLEISQNLESDIAILFVCFSAWLLLVIVFVERLSRWIFTGYFTVDENGNSRI